MCRPKNSAFALQTGSSTQWTVEADYEGEGWQSIGVTYKDWYKEDCKACTGPCQKEDALTTDETDVPGVSLVLGHYVGGTFVAA